MRKPIATVSDILTREEIQAFSERSDARGGWAVLSTWLTIAAAFAVLAWLPHPLTFVAVVVFLGGRQLALVVLMHEAAHRTLFRRQWLNDVATDWLCARPVWTDVARYRKHHVKHHAHTGTELDPDMSLVAPFPIARASLARKLLRDVVGISGLKRCYGLLLMDMELLSYTVAADPKRLPWRGLPFHLRALARHTSGALVTNLLLFAALAAVGQAWLYLAWVCAFFTTYGVFLRVRSMSEHACAPGDGALHNTRTTRAGWLARLTVAPLAVNFHLEHHLLISVPFFRLPALHRLLAERGALTETSVAPSYAAVLRLVTRR
jgi:fatty acid desaturase